MKPPDHGNAAREVKFKRHANLFTLISVLWTCFTLLGIYLFRQTRDPDYKTEMIIAIIIWVLHAAFIGLSVYFSITERPSVLMVESDEDEED